MWSASPFELDHHISMSLHSTRSLYKRKPTTSLPEKTPRALTMRDLGLCSWSRSANELRDGDTYPLHMKNCFRPLEVINNQMPVKVNKLTSESAGSEMLKASQPMDLVDSMAKLPATQPPREQFICPCPEELLEILKRGQLLYTVKYFCCMHAHFKFPINICAD